MVAAAITAMASRISVGAFLTLARVTASKLALAELTIAAVLALAYVMNYSGATATLGLAVASTGALLPFFGAFLGGLGHS